MVVTAKTANTVPLCVPNLAGNEARYLQECVDTGFVSSVGPFVSRFEEMVSAISGAPHAVATASGTCGLHVALIAAGVRPGDLVVLPSFTFMGSANAVAHCGATPWLLDIRPDDWCLDPALVEQALERETYRGINGIYHRVTGRRVSALMPVYTLGMIPAMPLFRALGRRFGLTLVADAAPALEAKRSGTPSGQFADVSVFSFNGNKTVTSGGGGAVVGADETLLAHIRHLTTTARADADYNFDMVGYNYRMTNLEAAVGCAQLEQIEVFAAAKRRIRDQYRRDLGDVGGLEFFPDAPDAQNACWLSGVVLPANGPAVSVIAAQLAEAGIQARPFWKPVHLQPPFAGAPRTATPVTDALWQRILTLPCSTHLSEAAQAFVIDKTRAALYG